MDACSLWAASVGCTLDLRIKWPNDLFAGGKKLGGIVCESFKHEELSGQNSGNTVIIAGIGINLSQGEFHGSYRTQPSSLYTVTGTSPSPLALVGLLATQLTHKPGSQWRARMMGSLYGLGKTVRFRPGANSLEPVVGTLAGIGADGSVIIETNDGTQNYLSGDLEYDSDAD